MSEKIYCDILMTNGLDESFYPDVAFSENRALPLLTDSTNYYMSIVRFSLNTSTLPVLIPSMKNKDETNYSITLEYNGVYVQSFIYYSSQSNLAKNHPEYLYIRNYQYFLYLINNTFNECLNSLKTLVALPASYTSSPLINIDMNSKLCYLEYDSSIYGFNQTGKINIYFNDALGALFSSFPFYIANLSNGRIFQFDIRINSFSNNIIQVLSQELSSVGLWNPVASIVFTSNLIPVVASATPPIQMFKNGYPITNSSNSNFLNVITDFIGSELLFTPFVIYNPTAQFRYIELKPNCEIRNLDLQVYWLNKNTGAYIPLKLSPGGSCSIKILFTDKQYL